MHWRAWLEGSSWGWRVTEGRKEEKGAHKRQVTMCDSGRLSLSLRDAALHLGLEGQNQHRELGKGEKKLRVRHPHPQSIVPHCSTRAAAHKNHSGIGGEPEEGAEHPPAHTHTHTLGVNPGSGTKLSSAASLRSFPGLSTAMLSSRKVVLLLLSELQPL